MKEMIINADINNLNTIIIFVEEFMNSYNCHQADIALVTVGVEEVFVNIAHYAYTSNQGKVLIRISKTLNTFEIEFEDQGIPFNPLKISSPDITLPAEEREIGGLGIMMLKKIMDSVEYNYIGNKNILKLKKSFFNPS